MDQVILNPPSIVVGASLTGPSVGFPIEAWESVHALSVVVNVAPASTVCHFVAFTVAFLAHVPIALTPLQLTSARLSSHPIPMLPFLSISRLQPAVV